MHDSQFPLDADELMNFSDRIEQLPAAEAEWVNRLFEECMRARLSEAELLAASADAPELPPPGGIDDSQLAQVVLDAAEWLKTLWEVGYMGAGSFPAAPRTTFPRIGIEDVLKSSLFARIREGKRPLPFPPPTRNGLPWHELVEDPVKLHIVEAEVIRDERNQAIGAIVEGCSGWIIVEEVTASESGNDFLVQHRSKGPLFRLHIGYPVASLRREQPRWQRKIRQQERGGVRSFTLDWPKTDGSVQDVPLRAATWERAETEAAHWVATNCPEMYGQIYFERAE